MIIALWKPFSKQKTEESSLFPNFLKKESWTEIGNFEEIRFRQQGFISSC
jgi:hypothetical protein